MTIRNLLFHLKDKLVLGEIATCITELNAEIVTIAETERNFAIHLEKHKREAEVKDTPIHQKNKSAVVSVTTSGNSSSSHETDGIETTSQQKDG